MNIWILNMNMNTGIHIHIQYSFFFEYRCLPVFIIHSNKNLKVSVTTSVFPYRIISFETHEKPTTFYINFYINLENNSDVSSESFYFVIRNIFATCNRLSTVETLINSQSALHSHIWSLDTFTNAATLYSILKSLWL